LTDGGPGPSRIAELAHGGVTWVLADRPTADDVAELAERFELHPLDVEELARRGGRPKLAIRAHYSSAVLDFPVQLARPRRTALGQLNLMVGGDFVLASHGGDLRPPVRLMDDLRRDAKRRESEMASPGRLAYTIARGLVEASEPLVARLGSAVDNLQEELLAGVAEAPIQQLNQIRREMTSLGRVLRPDVEVLFAMARAPFTTTGDLSAYWELLADALQRQVDQLEDGWNAVEALVESAESLARERADARMRALLLFAGLLLPIVTVGLVYLMAVQAVPSLANEADLDVAIGLMLIAVVALVGWLRRRRLV